VGRGIRDVGGELINTRDRGCGNQKQANRRETRGRRRLHFEMRAAARRTWTVWAQDRTPTVAATGRFEPGHHKTTSPSVAAAVSADSEGIKRDDVDELGKMGHVPPSPFPDRVTRRTCVGCHGMAGHTPDRFPGWSRGDWTTSDWRRRY